jgi:peptide/nickel transport system permease protein
MQSLILDVHLVCLWLCAWTLSSYLGVDAYETDLLVRFSPPSARHWLGTDGLGRDVFIRLLYGGQVSLAVGIVATALASLIGIVIGIAAGFIGGRVDGVLMRSTDCVIALPLVPLMIVLGSVDLTKIGLSPEAANSFLCVFLRIVVIIALVDWTTMARIARAGAIQLRDCDYVRAAAMSGATWRYNMLVHILPNISTQLVIVGALSVGRVILLESTLSFLGFGIVPPVPSWGNMLTDAQQFMISAPSLAIYPGLLIFVTVMAVNFVGDGIRHVFDPRAETASQFR